MRYFIPEKVYFEPQVLNYEMGKKLLDKYISLGIEIREIENHNNIPIMRNMPNTEFVNMKKFLVLGVRKTLKLIPNNLSADFIVPFTSSGCSAMCLYCYLVCTYFKCSYLRIFVNREAMMDTIKRKASKLNEPKIFELGCNSDMVLENALTENLNWAIEEFGKIENATATLATKFSMVDDLLNLNHNGHTMIRMSVNPEFIINKIEIGTSNLIERIEAINKLFRAGYRVGLNIAPIILLNGWQKMYSELFEILDKGLDTDLKKQLFIELIFMTFGYANRDINAAAFPGAVEVFNKNLMKPKGRGKYMYKPEIKKEAEAFIKSLIKKYFPYASIKYIV